MRNYLDIHHSESLGLANRINVHATPPSAKISKSSSSSILSLRDKSCHAPMNESAFRCRHTPLKILLAIHSSSWRGMLFRQAINTSLGAAAGSQRGKFPLNSSRKGTALLWVKFHWDETERNAGKNSRTTFVSPDMDPSSYPRPHQYITRRPSKTIDLNEMMLGLTLAESLDTALSNICLKSHRWIQHVTHTPSSFCCWQGATGTVQGSPWIRPTSIFTSKELRIKQSVLRNYLLKLCWIFHAHQNIGRS